MKIPQHEMERLNGIVDRCFELQLNKNANLPALESQLKQTQTKINNLMNAIMQGITTPTTKTTLENLEEEKSTLEISIAKENIERPILSREQIKHWICKFNMINLDNIDHKMQFIRCFVNSVHVYDDKMVITFNYKDNDKAVTFDEVNEMLNKKENSHNCNSYESSPLSLLGDPLVTRTPDPLIKSDCEH